MRKIITSISMLAMIGSCSAVMAGGPDRFAMAEPAPAPVVQDYFSGLSIGLIGSFWDNHFNSQSSGRLVANDETPDPLVDLLFNNDGNGVDLTGGIGVQLAFGKVFPTSTNGYYLGIYGGGIWGSSEDTITASLDAALNDRSMADAISGLAGSSIATQVKMDNIYNAGLQAGILLAPKTMLYVKGGAAWTTLTASTNMVTNLDVAISDVDSLVINGKANLEAHQNKLGFEVGAGVSQALTDNILVSLEYVFRDFGKVEGSGNIVSDDSETPIIANTLTTSTDLKQSSVQATVSYRFNFLG